MTAIIDKDVDITSDASHYERPRFESRNSYNTPERKKQTEARHRIEDLQLARDLGINVEEIE